MMIAQAPTGHESTYSAYRTHHSPPLPDAPASSHDQRHLLTRGHRLLTHTAASQLEHSSHAYMNSNFVPPFSQQSYQSSPNHGVKRTAPDDDFEKSSHISNEFKKLRLNNNRRPTQHFSQPTVRQYDAVNALPQPAQMSQDTTSPPTYPLEHLPSLPSNDFMTVDETPDRVYIPDIESEIAAIEAAERSSSQLFLPDFEKQIGAIPDHVLRPNPTSSTRDGERGVSGNDQALVLYQDPSSISVPEEEDAVRKAILEARRGIREKIRRQQQRERETANANTLINHRGPGGFIADMTRTESQGGGQPGVMHDLAGYEDAMDLE